MASFALASTLIFSTASHAQSVESYIAMDKQLKRVLNENSNASSKIKLHNFLENKVDVVDIYQLSNERGAALIPQDEMSSLLYKKFVENGFLPIIAVLETNKVFLESQEKVQ